MSSSPVGWSRLRMAATVIYQKAVIGLALIYIVYYLKKGGFNTASLEITLVGCLLALVTTMVIRLCCPEVIAKFSTDDEYEEYVQSKIERKQISSAFWISKLEKEPAKPSEVLKLGYEFDKNSDLTTDNIKLCLGEIGANSFAAKLIYLRNNDSLPLVRWLIAIVGMLSIIMMYHRAIEILLEIYFQG